MSASISVTTWVEAGHQDLLGRMHGHSYQVEVWMPEGNDLVAVAAFINDVKSRVDHSMLEATVGSPKMEDLARWFLAEISIATEVIVRRPSLGFAARVVR